jgi:hypothetical protein
MKRLEWVDDEKEEILRLYSSLSYTKISKKYGVSPAVIRDRLIKWGVTMFPSSRHKVKMSGVILLDLYWNKKMSVSNIADYLGVDRNAVYARLKEFNIDRRDPLIAFGICRRKWCCESPFQGIVYVKSNWERKVGNYLNKSGKKWYYEPHFIKLPSGTSYLPDFFICDENLYIEVKGRFRNKDKAKFIEAASMYNIELWDGYKLQDMGIINDSRFRKRRN